MQIWTYVSYLRMRHAYSYVSIYKPGNALSRNQKNKNIPPTIFRSCFLDITLPETNSSPLKMVVSNRNILFQGAPFSGANC